MKTKASEKEEGAATFSEASTLWTKQTKENCPSVNTNVISFSGIKS